MATLIFGLFIGMAVISVGFTSAQSKYGHSTEHLSGVGIQQYPALVGDFDGDELMDLAFAYQGEDGSGLNIMTKFSNGDGSWRSSANQLLGDKAGIQQYPTLVGDVDGDGLMDLVFAYQSWDGSGLNIRTKFSNGDGTWRASAYQIVGDGHEIHQHPTLVGDVDGDGLMDLVFAFQGWDGSGLNIRTKFSNGDGTWRSSAYQIDGSGIQQYPTLVGDVDGDGLMDLVFAYKGWYDFYLDIRTKFSNGDGTWRSSYSRDR